LELTQEQRDAEQQDRLVSARETDLVAASKQLYSSIDQEENAKFSQNLLQDRAFIDSAKMLHQSTNGTPFEGDDAAAVQSGIDYVETLSKLNRSTTTEKTREDVQPVLDVVFRDLDSQNQATKIASSYLLHTANAGDPIKKGEARVNALANGEGGWEKEETGWFQSLVDHAAENFQSLMSGDEQVPYMPLATPGWVAGGYLKDAVVGVVKGIPDGAQGILDLGHDIDNVFPMGKIVWGRGNGLEWIASDDPGYTDMPTVQLPQFAHGDSGVEEAARVLGHFFTVFAAGGGLAGTMARVYAAGALADATFDPEMGNLSTMLKEMDIENEFIDFLDSQVGEDATAEERLRARGKQGIEGGLISVPIDLIITGIKTVKRMGAVPAVKALLNNAGEKWKALLPPPGQLNMGVGTTGAAGPVPKQSWTKVTDQRILAKSKETQQSFKRKDGWMPIDPVKGEVTTSGKVKVEYKKIPYAFHNPRGNSGKVAWSRTITKRMVADIGTLVQRATSGDANAKDILAQATWYRDMRARMRAEFGGMADVFADVLGATSAQTDVRQNWKNGIEIMRRFTRGEFDAEIKAFQARLDAGESVNGTDLTQLFKAGEFPLITAASGKLFNANSPAATGALVDIFRTIKAGRSPKTPNFTGNLIGFTDNATIDVWAARYLRNKAGLKYIPPPAETGVGGAHLKGSTIENPILGEGTEFGFGQQVFRAAADDLNQTGLIRNYDESLGELGPDDLQAIIWFLEKEKWTNNGWTTKAGEGGSLDFEASLAGSANPERINEIRGLLNTQKGKNLTPEQRSDLEVELEQLAVPLQRTVLGLSRERPGQVPTNQQQLELAQEVDAVVRDDQSVVAYKTNNTYGRFMGDDERAIDAEFVTREDFDPTNLSQAVIRLGKEKDQDAVFISRVVTADHANARPGVEVYFTHSGGPDRARELSDKLTEYGIDGFTYITDARQADRIEVQAGTGEETAAIVGLRVQYIPEFEVGDAWKNMSVEERNKLMYEKEDIFDQIAIDLAEEGGISQVNPVYYDTDVIQRGEYDARLGRQDSQTRRKGRQGSQTGADVPVPVANAGNQRTGNVPNGQRAQGGSE
tara:strand:- start:5574 stop:8843 length:3270 start_codon:yes stop_codon:yes gene_type:complete